MCGQRRAVRACSALTCVVRLSAGRLWRALARFYPDPLPPQGYGEARCSSATARRSPAPSRCRRRPGCDRGFVAPAFLCGRLPPPRGRRSSGPRVKSRRASNLTRCDPLFSVGVTTSAVASPACRYRGERHLRCWPLRIAAWPGQRAWLSTAGFVTISTPSADQSYEARYVIEPAVQRCGEVIGWRRLRSKDRCSCAVSSRPHVCMQSNSPRPGRPPRQPDHLERAQVVLQPLAPLSEPALLQRPKRHLANRERHVRARTAASRPIDPVRRRASSSIINSLTTAVSHRIVRGAASVSPRSQSSSAAHQRLVS